MNSLFLQIFVLLNVFLIGALTMVAIRHALAHFKPHHHDAEKVRPTHEPVHLSPAVKHRLMKEAEVKLQAVLDRSAVQLERSLTETTGRLDRQLERLGSKIISDEMARYNKALDELQAHTQISISGAQAEISQHQDDLKVRLAERQAELEAKLAEDMAAEKERLLSELDTKLADAVTSFLLETMTHEVDLGAQNAYLIRMLDEHKDEITKGVRGEA